MWDTISIQVHFGWTSHIPDSIQGSRSHSTGSLVAIHAHQADASFTFTQPATVKALVQATPTKPPVAISSQKTPGYCVTCTPLGKQCHRTYPMPLHSNWLDSKEEEKDPKEEEIENWNGDIKRQKELKELQLKNNNVTIPQSCPKSQSTSTSDIDKTVVHIQKIP